MGAILCEATGNEPHNDTDQEVDESIPGIGYAVKLSQTPSGREVHFLGENCERGP